MGGDPDHPNWRLPPKCRPLQAPRRLRSCPADLNGRSAFQLHPAARHGKPRDRGRTAGLPGAAGTSSPRPRPRRFASCRRWRSTLARSSRSGRSARACAGSGRLAEGDHRLGRPEPGPVDTAFAPGVDQRADPGTDHRPGTGSRSLRSSSARTYRPFEFGS